VVPVVIWKSLRILDEVTGRIVIPSGSEVHVFNIFTGSMSRAIIRARCALASLAFITIETLAFARFSVANTTVGAFSVLVEGSLLVRSINPSKLKWANSV
jgi:hypothetical protein